MERKDGIGDKQRDRGVVGEKRDRQYHIEETANKLIYERERE